MSADKRRWEVWWVTRPRLVLHNGRGAGWRRLPSTNSHSYIKAQDTLFHSRQVGTKPWGKLQPLDCHVDQSCPTLTNLSLFYTVVLANRLPKMRCSLKILVPYWCKVLLTRPASVDLYWCSIALCLT